MTAETTSEAGFTLIETLVGFIILSGAIILSLSAMTQALQRMRRSAEIVRASELARSAFVSISMQKIRDKGISTGAQGDMTWQIEVVPLGRDLQDVARPSLVRVKIFNLRGEEIPQAGFDSVLIMQAGP
jgi:Tfp pilus assembly protein PilV